VLRGAHKDTDCHGDRLEVGTPWQALAHCEADSVARHCADHAAEVCCVLQLARVKRARLICATDIFWHFAC
jgi:hypothetical protein